MEANYQENEPIKEEVFVPENLHYVDERCESVVNDTDPGCDDEDDRNPNCWPRNEQMDTSEVFENSPIAARTKLEYCSVRPLSLLTETLRRTDDCSSSVEFWPRCAILALIDGYRKAECLWNIRNETYKNRDCRELAMEKLCNDLSPMKTVTKEEIKRKINILRSQFSREVKRIQASKKAATGTSDVVKPKLWFFNELKFLQEGCIIGNATATFSIQHTDQSAQLTTGCSEALDDVVAVGAIPQISIPSPSSGASETDDLLKQFEATATLNDKLKLERMGSTYLPATVSSTSKAQPKEETKVTTRKRKLDKADEVLEVALKHLMAKPDKYALFGEYIAGELREMNEEQRPLAKKYIHEIIYFGTLGKLTRTMKITFES